MRTTPGSLDCCCSNGEAQREPSHCHFSKRRDLQTTGAALTTCSTRKMSQAAHNISDLLRLCSRHSQVHLGRRVVRGCDQISLRGCDHKAIRLFSALPNFACGCRPELCQKFHLRRDETQGLTMRPSNGETTSNHSGKESREGTRNVQQLLTSQQTL